VTAAGPSAPRDLRAVATLGAAAGLGLPSLVDGLLLPQIDEAPARAVTLALAGLALSVGWIRAGMRRTSVGAWHLRAWAVAVLLGGGLSAWLLPRAHERLLTQVVADSPWPGSLLLASFGLAVLLPFGAPLGALIGAALDDRARALAAVLLGLGAGLLAAPWLGEEVLGRAGTVQVAAVLAAAAALPLAEGAPLVPGRARLALPTVMTLLVTGLTAAAVAPLLLARVDLGSATSSWLGAATFLGAGVGVLAARRLPPGPLAALPCLALPWLLGWSPAVLPRPVPSQGTDILLVAGIGAVLGWPAGRWLAAGSGERGMRGGLVPLLTLATLPVATLVLLPLGGRWGLVALSVVLLALTARSGLSPRALVAPGIAALVLLVLPLPARSLGVAPAATELLPSAVVSRVHDPVTGRPVLAVDGQAPQGRSRLQHRRLVHLPLLFQHADASDGQLGRVLVVSQDEGQAADAAALHQPARLDWLAPLPDAWSQAAAALRPEVVLARGNERLHLRRETGLHEAIVLLPDPRVRRRAGILGTREHFAGLLERLTPDGLFCQWLDLSSLDVTDVKAIIGSAMDACPEVALVLDHPRTRHGVVGIVGGRRPFSLQLDRVEARLGRLKEVRAELAVVGLDALLVCALPTQTSGVVHLLAPAERGLGDDRPALGMRAVARDLPWPDTATWGLSTFADRRTDASGWIRVPADERDALGAHTRDLIAGWQHVYGGAQDVIRLTDGVPPAFEDEGPGRFPDAERDRLAEALAALPDWTWLRALVTDHALWITEGGRGDVAEQMLRRAVERVPQSASLRFALARVVEASGDLADACVLYRTVIAFDGGHAEAAAALARLDCEG
jgi:spermidine synthase